MQERSVQLLSQAADYDLCAACAPSSALQAPDARDAISYAIGANGRRVPLLKILQTNYCQKDCLYCANRSDRDTRRAIAGPDELARQFIELARRRRVEGLFLSSGVWGGANRSMERMLATVELVRRRYHFAGYVHLKILPGADDATILEAIELADRVSVNLEAPNAQRIQALSHTKDYRQELLAPLFKAHRLRQESGRAVSMTTQFVVGAADESDRELLRSVGWLYQHVQLARAYYSAFSPIRDTPLENHDPAPQWRQNRLYQADALLRQYEFLAEEVVFDASDKLPRDADPKLAWALAHPERFPIEVNGAERRELLRVPGLGPGSVDVILRRRRQGTLRELDDLGIVCGLARRAAPFVLLDGRRPTHQMPLWPRLSIAGEPAADALRSA